jgi:amidase
MQTDGSILCPSSRNNIVGIKPTVGLTSRHLVIPLSEHQDSIGPMARTVKDAAHILQIIAGSDLADNYTLAIPNKGKLPNYIAACNASSLKGARIGVPRNVIRISTAPRHAADLKAFEDAVKTIKSLGATVTDPTNFPNAVNFRLSNAESNVINADFLVNLPAYTSLLTSNPNNITGVASLREFTKNSPLEHYPERNTKLWDIALDEQGWNNTDTKFWPVYQKSMFFGDEGGLLGTLRRENLDAVILPTTFASSWAATVGAPVITVPLGFHPSNAKVVMNPRGDLVDAGPRIP